MGALHSIFGWMVSDKSLGPATWGLVVVTLLLVVVTFLLVLDGWSKSREQSRRWHREDQRRIEDAMPTAVIEIAVDVETDGMSFVCFNLGTNAFFIDEMQVTVTGGMRSISNLTPRVLTPGTFVQIPYNCHELLREKDGLKEANAAFVLKGATGTITTAPTWFCFYPTHDGKRCGWEIGRLSDRQPGTIPAKPKIMPGVIC
jgi:hypothetical protein